jgi:hypothetical protein
MHLLEHGVVLLGGVGRAAEGVSVCCGVGGVP